MAENFFCGDGKAFYICNHSANQLLTILGTYRAIVAVLLLSTYAFIAAPVQLWHHHTASYKSAKDFPAWSKDNGKTDVDCPVCSHKYSTYNQITLVSFETIPPCVPVVHGGYLHHRFAADVVLLPNKGPPVTGSYKA